MPGLEDQIEEVSGSDVWVASAARNVPVTGTPLVSATANEDGSAIADNYTLTFENVDPGVSADVHVACDSPNNPHSTEAANSPKFGTVYTVDLDGVTEYDNIVPSATVIFSDDVGFLDNWEAELRVGRYAGQFQAFNNGVPVPGTGRRHRVENTGIGPGTNCKAQLVTLAVLYTKVGTVFEFISPFAEDAAEKQTDGKTAPYAVTVENKAGVGAAITADIKFDGALVNVADEDGNVTTSEDLTVVNTYTVDDGDLEGLAFRLSQLILNTATANVLIFENLHTQIAPDIAGAAGTYGTDDVVLTEDGEDDGTITAGGFAYYWERTLVVQGANSISNPRPGSVRLYGEASEAAGWE